MRRLTIQNEPLTERIGWKMADFSFESRQIGCKICRAQFHEFISEIWRKSKDVKWKAVIYYQYPRNTSEPKQYFRNAGGQYSKEKFYNRFPKQLKKQTSFFLQKKN